MAPVRSLKALYNACNKIQHKLLPPIVVLGIVVLIIRWANTPPAGHVWHLDAGVDGGMEFTQLDDTDIQKYIHAMEDSRSQECKQAEFKGLGDHTVSIILDFVDHEFYDLKMTLEAIIKYTPAALYREIIIVDDGSGHEHVKEDALKYLGHPKFKKVKAFRSEKSDGMALSRFKGSKLAKGSILVFLSSRTAVNEGWLEPLIEEVKREPKQIAVPHMDSLLSNYRFFKIQDNLINVFDWKLSLLFMETEERSPLLKTPVMTGDVFAVDAEFFNSIGNYDEGFQKGGAENLELSLRTWMCGGTIAIVTCSRVAVVNALKPHPVVGSPNFRRVAELWLGKYQRTAYKTASISMDMSEAERQSVHVRKNYIERHLECADFNSYLRTVAGDVLLPPEQSRGFGKLSSGTGYCLHSRLHEDGRIVLQGCKPHMYEPSMVFTLDLQGRISYRDSCLDMTSSTVSLRPCLDDADGQAWQRTAEGQLQSMRDLTKCLAHAVHEDNSHYLAVKECTEERDFLWSFIKY